MKYGPDDDAIGAGIFSGRYTSTIVAAGYVAKQILKKCGIEVFSYVKEIAGVACPEVDHEKAFIVMLTDGKEKVNTIKSNIAGHVRLSGGSRSKSPYGPQDVASEKKVEEKRKHHLQDYYQEIYLKEKI